MICIFGDTHGVYELNKVFDYYDRFKDHITTEDCFIILGDFALPYYPLNDFQNQREKAALDHLSELKCKILIVDGNHEYFDYLDKREQVDMFGGKVGKIWDNVYHLKRGNIYTIDNKLFFVCGGARSIDRAYQESKGTWSKREIPSKEEIKNAVTSLKNVGYKVDYILSHTAPNVVFKQKVVPVKLIEDFNDPTMDLLDMVYKRVKYRNWYCAHFHIDYTFDNFSFLYNEVRHI